MENQTPIKVCDSRVSPELRTRHSEPNRQLPREKHQPRFLGTEQRNQPWSYSRWRFQPILSKWQDQINGSIRRIATIPQQALNSWKRCENRFPSCHGKHWQNFGLDQSNWARNLRRPWASRKNPPPFRIEYPWPCLIFSRQRFDLELPYRECCCC